MQQAGTLLGAQTETRKHCFFPCRVSPGRLLFACFSGEIGALTAARSAPPPPGARCQRCLGFSSGTRSPSSKCVLSPLLWSPRWWPHPRRCPNPGQGCPGPLRARDWAEGLILSQSLWFWPQLSWGCWCIGLAVSATLFRQNLHSTKQSHPAAQKAPEFELKPS